MSSVYLSLVIPVYNEEVNIKELVERCTRTCYSIGKPYEIVLVDDGSRDQSIDLIKQASAQHPQVVGVLLNRNFGQHAAVTAGLEHARGDSERPCNEGDHEGRCRGPERRPQGCTISRR